jgi:hypothetical protein
VALGLVIAAAAAITVLVVVVVVVVVRFFRRVIPVTEAVVDLELRVIVLFGRKMGMPCGSTRCRTPSALLVVLCIVANVADKLSSAALPIGPER